ncbi:FtsK/SpoIIIE domain-containing protein [Microbacterium dauci]|uniref:FtsK/SpoIIIE domain-containing protein n=1 Tax=Microbacterium dauci TaxID=3048008 RepID=A0ABT6ZA53_9MICO|nr:FtsK/SpoIIIE domain-containing protein [Microbacterium sp. LX3-4]MDJ1113050.1 FtsK/SpoIIIE domain-containing protein [Microbacterium sp. LX3-4]
MTTSTPLLRGEPISLPRGPESPQRPPIPILAASVPVAGALVLWAVTGSPFALWFALLGPLIAVASVADAARGSRRSRRRHVAQSRIALVAARAEVDRRHDAERAERWTRHPDVAHFLEQPDAVWRTVAARDGVLVVGAGAGESELRVTGGEGDGDADEVRRGAAQLTEAPVLVPLTTGIAVIGPPVLAAAVARGLALQVCLSLPPGRLRLVEDGPGWTTGMPHRDAAIGLLLQLRETGGLVGADVDVPIIVVPEGAPAPPRCGAVLRLTGPATARLDLEGSTIDVAVEPISTAHAAAVAAHLADRATRALGRSAHETVAFDDLVAAQPIASPDAAVAAFASSSSQPLLVDLVGDGPHAIVTGVTGAGKSELLTSWVVALCAAHTPSELAFLLVDFKGGRTFDHLTALPHVTGVLTDLDETTAIRAIRSLRAEVRHREQQLADAGSRDIAEAPALGRLVIVVDEYAALVVAHPELHDLFGDLAARGRALGIHLILATQRATGVFRDAVLANAPLRISLRVTDAADSRAVLGVDDAARLPGRADARGLALVRRAGDAAPVAARVARCDRDSLERVVAHTAGAPARRPWLPALPTVVPLDAVRRPGAVVLGLEDEPERQRQEPVVWDEGDVGLAVIGGSGSGRSSLVAAIAAQAPTVHVGVDAEAAWDALARLDEVPRGAVVAVDDLDAVLAGLPAEYAAGALERLEGALRGARARGIRLVVTTQRMSGGVARLVELMPRRVVLALPSRTDHVAAGGHLDDHAPDLPAGRGRIGRTLLQVALTSEPLLVEVGVETAPPWHPGRRPAAVVAPAGPPTRRLVAAWERMGIEVQSVEGGTRLRRGAVAIGAPDAWLAQWRLLADARADADLVVDASCAGEYRALTGLRDLPPFAHPGQGRAWVHAPDRPVRRVRLDPS